MRCIQGFGTILAVTTTVVALDGAALAGTIPALTYQVQTSTGYNSGVVAPPGVDQVVQYFYDVPFTTGGGLAYWGDINARDSAHPNAGMIATTLNFRNDTASTMDIVMDIWLPDNTGGLPIIWEDSTSLTLQANPGPNGQMTSVGGNAIWTVLIDSLFVDDLFDAPAILDVGGSSAGNLSTTATNGPFAQIISEVQVRMVFSLTAGDTAGINGSFLYAAVPAPGALALLGLAGLVGGRRRRK